MRTTRRLFIGNTAFLAFTAKLSKSFAATETVDCFMNPSECVTENTDSPFFEHYHQLTIPVKALIQLPADGIVAKTTPVDPGSYDVEGFKKFITSSGLNAVTLIKHDHDVKLNREQLERIAKGDKDVEVRVISKNGNYVHNFLVTASPAVLAKIRKFKI